MICLVHVCCVFFSPGVQMKARNTSGLADCAFLYRYGLYCNVIIIIINFSYLSLLASYYFGIYPIKYKIK